MGIRRFSTGGRDYECRFYDDCDSIPARMLELIRNTEMVETAKVAKPYVIYDGYAFFLHREGPERYGIDIGSLEIYFTRKNIFDPQTRARIYRELDRMVNITHELPIEVQRTEEKEYWYPSIRIGQSEDNWTSILLDTTRGELGVVGIYSGAVEYIDENTFNKTSSIKLR
jgi:hypothetical protein